MHDADTGNWSRRRILGAAAGGIALGALAGGTSALAHGDIQTYSTVGGQRTVYEGNGALTSFGYRPSFHTRCDAWMNFWNSNTPSGFATPYRVWSYGVHADHRVSEAHNNGRGFDLTRIYVTSSGSLVRRFNGRYDQWNGTTSAATERLRYWATAASLHYHFRHVLTYLYNTDHHNHIHFDNLISGTGNSTFSTSSEAQVQHVQACCRYIWGKTTTIDGIWGPQTNQHSHEVLVRIGTGGYLTTSQTHWLSFNRGSTRKGYGTQAY